MRVGATATDADLERGDAAADAVTMTRLPTGPTKVAMLCLCPFVIDPRRSTGSCLGTELMLGGEMATEPK